MQSEEYLGADASGGVSPQLAGAKRFWSPHGQRLRCDRSDLTWYDYFAKPALDSGASDRIQPPERAPLRAGLVAIASLISRQCAYCCFLTGFGSSCPCSQKRNQSMFRS